jgi:hypothetical protein
MFIPLWLLIPYLVISILSAIATVRRVKVLQFELNRLRGTPTPLEVIRQRHRDDHLYHDGVSPHSHPELFK